MLLEPLGIPISDTPPRLFLSKKEENDAGTLLMQHGVTKDSVVIGINPGATYEATKDYSK